MKIPTIVIVGAGFGGVYTARHLRSWVRAGYCKVILINDTNYFLFTPLLHEVATGGLSPLSIAEPIREVFRESDVDFIQASVSRIDFVQKAVYTDTCTISYDYVVLATGSESDFHGIPGAAEYSLTLKSLRDAARIRSRIIDVFERAARTHTAEERQKLLSFVVVGGGATGVELAGELADFCFGTMCQYYCGKGIVPRRDVTITLISKSEDLAASFHASIRTYARDTLECKGVQVRSGQSLVELSKEGVLLGNGERIIGSTVLYVGGVAPLVPSGAETLSRSSRGRVLVTEHLQSVDDPSVFALGDVAELAGAAKPMLAQIAVRESKTVARNIIALITGKPLRVFRYRIKGTLISVGQWSAAADISGVRICGKFAWLMWRTIYLLNFLSWKKRLKVAVEWTINLFYPRDITKLV